MKVKIKKAKDNVYDVRDAETGKWMFSEIVPEFLLERLAENQITIVEFIDVEKESFMQRLRDRST